MTFIRLIGLNVAAFLAAKYSDPAHYNFYGVFFGVSFAAAMARDDAFNAAVNWVKKHR